LPTTPSFDLRQKAREELAFVTLIHSDMNTLVVINTDGEPPGEYTLVLESFDTASALPLLTLKTDTITVILVA